MDLIRQLLVISVSLLALSACSTNPNVGTVAEKWEVDPESGDYKQTEVREITIYSSEDNDLPPLELPKK